MPKEECTVSELSSSRQDNVLLNAQEALTVPQDQETEDSVNEAPNPELNKALLGLHYSVTRLQPK